MVTVLTDLIRVHRYVEVEGVYGGMDSAQRRELRKCREQGLPDPAPAICAGCGDPYFKTRRGSLYCSMTCKKNEEKEKPRSAVCPTCRDRFTAVRTGKVYCSEACRYSAQNARARANTATQEV